MALTREDIAQLAQLARISLNDEELERAERELESILTYVDRLQNVDTGDVEEAAPPAVESPSFREDVAVSCNDRVRELIIQNFPAKQGDLLKAPAVFERPKK